MVEAIVTGIIANIATEGGRRVLQAIFSDNSLYTKVERAYSEALKNWTKNSQIRESESVWTRKRFQALLEVILDPKKEALLDSNILKLLQLFEVELQRDTLLWNHIQSRVFKQSISDQNHISANIDMILAEIESKRIDSFELLARLSSNIEFQIQKNIDSRKYIPDTFLEVDDMKENARYFCIPFLFYDKVFREVSNFNFDYLNTYLRSSDEAQFTIETSDYEVMSSDDFPALYKKSHAFEGYLKSKCTILEDGHYKRYASRYKLHDKVKDLNHFYSRILLLTANAGQGKTNFLCDLSENIVLKRGIPCIYLNGYEIDPNNVAESIVRSVFPINNNHTFFDILNAISNYCSTNKCTFLFIIDGLNENSDPQNFSRNLIAVIRELLRFDFVKIIISCRTEYFEHNYKEIQTVFSSLISIINYRNGNLTEAQKERLLDNYLSFFKIRARLSRSVKDQLIENFLLLRIFSEAYEEQTISHIPDLYKDEIFYRYYDKMSKTVAQRIKENGAVNMTPLLIQQFLTSIVKHMIQSHQFNNVPLDTILLEFRDLAGVYNRFLDENIIVKRDLVPSTKNVFGTYSEVINFTYDEFRDFLIHDYLLNVVYQQDPQLFNDFVQRYTIDERSIISDGLKSFLFITSKKHQSSELKAWIKGLPWYDNVYIQQIWSIEETYIGDDDIERIRLLLSSDDSIFIISHLVYGRWETQLYNTLNITSLFDMLNELDDADIEKYLYQSYVYRKRTLYDYRTQEIDFTRYVDQLENFLEDEAYNDNPEIHNLFYYLLYFIPRSYQANDLYMRYLSKTNNQLHRDLIEMVKSSKLKTELERL